MSRRIILVAFAILVSTSLISADEAMLAELKQLQGTWQAVQIEASGKQFEELAKQTRITIQGNQLTWGKENERTTYTFAIDPKRKPKTIDMNGTRKLLDETVEETYLAIYSLNGDEFKLCKYLSPKVLKDRPKEFKTAEGDANGLWVFRRVKP